MNSYQKGTQCHFDRLCVMSMNKSVPEEPSFITKAKVAQLLGYAPRTIGRMMAKGLPHYKIEEGRCRFRKDEVIEWVSENYKVVRNSL